MLAKAMQRLKIPQNFIDLIVNIFTNRKNRVFTEVGITNSYDVLVGIDQGEVLSPLLWCIYYDPLLCEVESKELGYTLSHTYKSNVYLEREDKYLEECISDVAFMDDTTWLTDDKEALEEILEIADDFYTLNNIKVNKDKSELLVHQPEADEQETLIELNFGSDIIKIKPALYKESVRILGVWVNLAGDRTYIINQAKDKVTQFCNIMKSKRVTDKQLLYLWNMVIIPYIEYRTQITFLDKNECDSIASIFRKFFKHKLRLSITAPNALLENRLIYNFRDLYEVQKQSKITNFLIQINDKDLLGRITNIRLKQLQTQEWLVTSPLVNWHYNEVKGCKQKKQFISSMLTLCKQNNITFNIRPEFRNRICGGKIELFSIMQDLWKVIKDKLRRHSILFLEQLTSLNGQQLLRWKSIMRKVFIDKAAIRKPLWFYQLEFKVLSNIDLRTVHQQYIESSTNMKGNSLTFPLRDNRKQDWVVIWNSIINKSILGRIVKKYQNTNTFIIEHWIIDESEVTCTLPTLKKCQGCIINNEMFNVIPGSVGDKEYCCTNIYTADDAIIFQTRHSKKISKSEYIFDVSIYEIYQWAEFHMKFFYNFILYKDDFVSLPLIEINKLLKFTNKGPIQKELFTIQHNLQNATNLEFYTDGSLIDFGKEFMSMGFAFVQTHNSAPKIEFKASLENWPTATRAETAALVAALLVTPVNCNIKIYTDSQSVIDHFKTNINNFSIRSFFRETDNILWEIIREVVKDNNLIIEFIKVDAHTGNYWNDIVDNLAKQSHNSNQLPLQLNSLYLDNIVVIPYWKNISIEINLRNFITKLSRNIGFEVWIQLNRNKKYRYNNVNWASTFLALNEEENTSDTSFLSSSRKANRIKFLIEELPTVEHMKKRRPDLYNNWLCPCCLNLKEDFNHIWMCSQHKDIFVYLAQIFKTELKNLIVDTTSISCDPDTFDLDDDYIWTPIFDTEHLTFIDLVKGIVPHVLFDKIFDIVKNKKITQDIIDVFLHRLQEMIKQCIWNPRCDQIIEKEKLFGINSKSKKKKVPSNYRREIIPQPVHNFINYDNYGLLMEIICGGSFLNFMILVNHLLGAFVVS
jgi:ribonuclease HI